MQFARSAQVSFAQTRVKRGLTLTLLALVLLFGAPTGIDWLREGIGGQSTSSLESVVRVVQIFALVEVFVGLMLARTGWMVLRGHWSFRRDPGSPSVPLLDKTTRSRGRS